MLSAVIIVLREFLEAALITSVLLAIGRLACFPLRWFVQAIVLGALGAMLLANGFNTISDWFEGVGQEVVNASMLLLAVIFIMLFAQMLVRYLQLSASSAALKSMLCVLATLVIALCLVRELAEIIVYLSGFAVGDQLQPVLIGGALGAGIGISAGALIYYALVNIAGRKRVVICLILLSLIAGGMSSQAALYLIQADWLPAQLPLWDSSALLAEQSIIGQLLYALIGYESTPTAIQLIFYAAVLVMVGCSVFKSFQMAQSQNFGQGLHE